ncbi:MAG: DUF393 domain-containing protein [Proteobacteria bacterium]|jgi:predicted DCC family thiol-disulfide oxidoreductase YuxK|nr:DUF393 domain-containing protein [Pseudomonadota bacterium]MDA1238942.1 DUF393 domain-containing protein [Pseudomonadota bacterium]
MSEIRVLYNAKCPVCNFEINTYQRYAREKKLTIEFDDLNTLSLKNWDLTQDQAAKRLYVLQEGQLKSGIDAFLALWKSMPRYFWLYKIVKLPILKHFSSVIYDYLLAPLVYYLHLRRRKNR